MVREHWAYVHNAGNCTFLSIKNTFFIVYLCWIQTLGMFLCVCIGSGCGDGRGAWDVRQICLWRFTKEADTHADTQKPSDSGGDSSAQFPRGLFQTWYWCLTVCKCQRGPCQSDGWGFRKKPCPPPMALTFWFSSHNQAWWGTFEASSAEHPAIENCEIIHLKMGSCPRPSKFRYEAEL